LWDTFNNIDKHEFMCEFFFSNTLGGGRTDISRAYYGDFHFWSDFVFEKIDFAEPFTEGVSQDSNRRREFNARIGIKTKGRTQLRPFQIIQHAKIRLTTFKISSKRAI
jgi:hypothetical protein